MPSEASRSASLPSLLPILTRRISIALSTSPSASSRALLAVHHPRAGLVAQGLDVGCGDRRSCGGLLLRRLGCGAPRLSARRLSAAASAASAAAARGSRPSGSGAGSAAAAAPARLRPRLGGLGARPAARRRPRRLPRRPGRGALPPRPRCCARCSSASLGAARSSASRRAFSSASRARLLLLGAELGAALGDDVADRRRRSPCTSGSRRRCPGSRSRSPSGSQLVSTRPMIGMRRRWASRTAISSVLRSITNIASGARCMCLTPPRFACELLEVGLRPPSAHASAAARAGPRPRSARGRAGA